MSVLFDSPAKVESLVDRVSFEDDGWTVRADLLDSDFVCFEVTTLDGDVLERDLEEDFDEIRDSAATVDFSEWLITACGETTTETREDFATETGACMENAILLDISEVEME